MGSAEENFLQKRSNDKVAKLVSESEEDRYIRDNIKIAMMNLKIKKAIDMIQKSIALRFSVLITGESGTGKSRIAKLAAYLLSKDAPIVEVDLAGMSIELVESELFGHRRGSFTNAVANREGMMTIANGGVLFCDEVGNWEPAVQQILLKPIEEKRFKPVGSNNYIYSDFAVVAATLLDLKNKKDFRDDLYYRLNKTEVRIPALRERVAEIMPIANIFLTALNGRVKEPDKYFGSDTLEAFLGYNWPGNLRELDNVITKSFLSTDGPIIMADDVTPHFEKNRCSSLCSSSDSEVIPEEQLKGKLVDAEEQMILQALEENDWVQKYAAVQLGISPRALNYKINKFKITHPNWKKNRGAKIKASDVFPLNRVVKEPDLGNTSFKKHKKKREIATKDAPEELGLPRG